MLQTLERDAKGQDKIARYGWKVSDQPGQFRNINKRLLFINRDVYQREGIKSKAIELASNWSWIACGALIVAERDGQFWVVDGQHRKLAADRRSDIQELPCLVFKVTEVADEAKAFLAANTNRRNVSALDKYRASLGAKNEIARKVQDAIEASGLRVTSASCEPRAFKSVAKAQAIAESDYDGLIAVLTLCGELAAVESCPVHARLMSGLYYIHSRVEGGLDNPRLRKRIKQIGAAALVNGAAKAAAYYGQAGNKVCAEGMLQVINSGLHTKFAFSE